MAVGRFTFIVEEKNDGQTVKTFLRHTCGLSARSMTVLKKSGMGITRIGELLKAHYILSMGDQVDITLPNEHCDIEPVEGMPPILYEDDRLLAVDKPASMPVHPVKDHQLDTLANRIAAYQQSRGESYVFRALNRLDKDTSGIVLIAKDRISYSLIKPTVKKVYFAVCEGIIDEAGTVDKPITLAPDSKMRRCVSADGDMAVTHYTPVEYGKTHTLCRIVLETGRTHQIRCHMSSIGHPLAGDDMYGGSLELISRQALHCAEVAFIHPDSGKLITLKTELPTEFLQIIKEGFSIIENAKAPLCKGSCQR